MVANMLGRSSIGSVIILFVSVLSIEDLSVLKKFTYTSILKGKNCKAEDTSFTENGIDSLECAMLCSVRGDCCGTFYSESNSSCVGCCKVYLVNFGLEDFEDAIARFDYEKTAICDHLGQLTPIQESDNDGNDAFGDVNNDTTSDSVTTDAHTTKADTINAITTAADTTNAITTAADTTNAITTVADTTTAITTEADTTNAITTVADTTTAITTEADTTNAITTVADTTNAITTEAETTNAITTVADTTNAITTLEDTPETTTDNIDHNNDDVDNFDTTIPDITTEAAATTEHEDENEQNGDTDAVPPLGGYSAASTKTDVAYLQSSTTGVYSTASSSVSSEYSSTLSTHF